MQLCCLTINTDDILYNILYINFTYIKRILSQ